MKSFAFEVVTVFEWEVPESPGVVLGRIEFVSKGDAVFAPHTPNATIV
jgi:hypothetical protein